MKTFGFPKALRVTKTDDFSSVFSLRKRIGAEFIVLHYQPTTHSSPRLGVIVGKKQSKSAVQRNYMKRVLREIFRQHQQQLPSADILVRVQKPFTRADFIVVQQEFITLGKKLTKKLAVTSYETPTYNVD